MQEKLGPVAGQYADQTRAAYVLHMLDEFIHHGAEVALLRDMWRWQQTTIADDGLVDRVIRGDAGVLDALRDPAARDKAAREHPDVVGVAAVSPIGEPVRDENATSALLGKLTVWRSVSVPASKPGFVPVSS